MLGLAIFLGILVFFWMLLRVPVVVTADYADAFTAEVRWLFLRILRVPAPEKKKKKPKKVKKKKEEKPKEEKKKEEKPKEEKPKENILARFYRYQGIPGFIELLGELVRALKKFGHGFGRAIQVRRFGLQMVITGGDPAEIAEKYGKTCAAVFPALGYLANHTRFKRNFERKIDIHPAFTGWDKKQVQCGAELAIRPSTLLAAVLALVARLGVRVLLKFLKGAKAPKAAAARPLPVAQKN